jgi:hypothetical protein
MEIIPGNHQDLLQHLVQIECGQDRLAGVIQNGNFLHGAGEILSGIGCITEVPKVTGVL